MTKAPVIYLLTIVVGSFLSLLLLPSDGFFFKNAWICLTATFLVYVQRFSKPETFIQYFGVTFLWILAMQQLLGPSILDQISPSKTHHSKGEVFLLVHASLSLSRNMVPVKKVGWGHGIVLSMVIWWCGLLMTELYFETWREKLRGFVVSVIGLVIENIIAYSLTACAGQNWQHRLEVTRDQLLEEIKDLNRQTGIRKSRLEITKKNNMDLEERKCELERGRERLIDSISVERLQKEEKYLMMSVKLVRRLLEEKGLGNN